MLMPRFLDISSALLEHYETSFRDLDEPMDPFRKFQSTFSVQIGRKSGGTGDVWLLERQGQSGIPRLLTPRYL